MHHFLQTGKPILNDVSATFEFAWK